MPRALAALAAALAVLVGATAVSAQPRVDSSALTVRLSTRHAGARNVAVTLAFHSLLTCGKVFGTVQVSLPQAVVVPARIDAAAVLANGKPAGSVGVSGHTVTILPAASGIICQSISEGTAFVTLTAAAGLGNPSRPGTYGFLLSHAGDQLRAAVAVSSSVAPSGGLFGTVMRGPTKPVCEQGMSCDAPAPGVLLSFLRGGTIAGTAMTSSTGDYRVLLPPGTYDVRAFSVSHVGGLKPVTATVGRALVRRDLFIDTGIR
jgi:hypothetical protein